MGICSLAKIWYIKQIFHQQPSQGAQAAAPSGAGLLEIEPARSSEPRLPEPGHIAGVGHKVTEPPPPRLKEGT